MLEANNWEKQHTSETNSDKELFIKPDVLQKE